MRAFEEGGFEDVSGCGVWAHDGAQEGFEIGVPADAETVLPAAEHGVSGPELEEGFLSAAAEARGADVADVVDEVGVHAAWFQGHGERAHGAGGRVVVLRHGPLHA